MGQAKQRGSFQERLEQSHARRSEKIYARVLSEVAAGNAQPIDPRLAPRPRVRPKPLLLSALMLAAMPLHPVQMPGITLKLP